LIAAFLFVPSGEVFFTPSWIEAEEKHLFPKSFKMCFKKNFFLHLFYLNSEMQEY
jgi:hypothetical protein